MTLGLADDPAPPEDELVGVEYQTNHNLRRRRITCMASVYSVASRYLNEHCPVEMPMDSFLLRPQTPVWEDSRERCCYFGVNVLMYVARPGRV